MEEQQIERRLFAWELLQVLDDELVRMERELVESQEENEIVYH